MRKHNLQLICYNNLRIMIQIKIGRSSWRRPYEEFQGMKRMFVRRDGLGSNDLDDRARVCVYGPVWTSNKTLQPCAWYSNFLSRGTAGGPYQRPDVGSVHGIELAGLGDRWECEGCKAQLR